MVVASASRAPTPSKMSGPDPVTSQRKGRRIYNLVFVPRLRTRRDAAVSIRFVSALSFRLNHTRNCLRCLRRLFLPTPKDLLWPHWDARLDWLLGTVSTYLRHGGERGGHRILTLSDDKINFKILIVNIYLAFNWFCLIFLTQKWIVQAPRKITAENEFHGPWCWCWSKLQKIPKLPGLWLDFATNDVAYWTACEIIQHLIINNPVCICLLGKAATFPMISVS